MLALEVRGNMTLTKRQQEALIEGNWVSNYWPSAEPLTPSDTWASLWLGCNTYFSAHTVYTLMSVGLAAFVDGKGVYLTPTGERLAAILAELPAPLTRRQWEVLLRFRDRDEHSCTVLARQFQCWRSTMRGAGANWWLPQAIAADRECTTEHTMRTLCDYGLLGFEYTDSLYRCYAHLTPLGEELTSLLP